MGVGMAVIVIVIVIVPMTVPVAQQQGLTMLTIKPAIAMSVAVPN
jgi:hypothetical protein